MIARAPNPRFIAALAGHPSRIGALVASGVFYPLSERAGVMRRVRTLRQKSPELRGFFVVR
ncbi:MAG: hypothetical protein B7X12_09470 [Halothiobacillus sp. 20-53-49]|nr:MAG: hypothetical protein B7X12_09470 [Halothiobacillus sp. 20-53-49]